MMKILLVGESWIIQTTHIKGVDWFTQNSYEEGARWLLDAWRAGGHVVDHMPSHLVPSDFPETREELSEYDLLVLSDIGANSFLLHPRVVNSSEPSPNRLDLIHNYVFEGGALIMIGGYMSFAGIDGRARFGGTAIEAALPVIIGASDDRREIPEGFEPRVIQPTHPAVDGLPSALPMMLFYNHVTPSPKADVLVEHDGDPILAVQTYGKGRSAAFTPDAAPHGAPPSFLEWDRFADFWNGIANWLVDREG